jgi:hypothetical protein
MFGVPELIEGGCLRQVAGQRVQHWATGIVAAKVFNEFVD